jgi:PAB1-binding protein PBP1
LAGRSAEAAKEIKSLIGASVERVEQGTLLVDEAGLTMSEVVTSIRRVTDLVAEISSASNEQSAGVAQVGEAVAQMDQTTQQNAALVEQMAAAASSLKTQAGELVGAVSVFKLDSNERVVKKEVRAKVTLAKPFPGVERRSITGKTAKSKIAPSTGTNPKVARIPVLSVVAKATPPKPAVDDSWETF